VRVIVNGANGKMGALACQAIAKSHEFVLVASLGRNDDLQAAIRETKPQIVVELTRADCVYQNSLTIINQGVHPVIGASGLNLEQIKILQQFCIEKHLGGLVVPNFSISAVLMMRFAAEAARLLPDVEIIEAHHPEKLDAPSGTAMKTAELIAAARQTQVKKPILQETLPSARGANYHDVHIHSVRLPGILARQQVIFGNIGDTLTITHETIDRSAFMPGLILACQKVQALDGLYYGLEHVIPFI
jgi:4-hydroxy-tetrahydrodipicolinate reductase